MPAKIQSIEINLFHSSASERYDQCCAATRKQWNFLSKSDDRSVIGLGE
jgi:hypothetical protein